MRELQGRRTGARWAGADFYIHLVRAIQFEAKNVPTAEMAQAQRSFERHLAISRGRFDRRYKPAPSNRRFVAALAANQVVYFQETFCHQLG